VHERSVRLRPADRGVWDGIVGSSDEALGFHEWDWLDLQESVLGVVFQRLVVEVDGTPVGVFPVSRRSQHATRYYRPPFPFLGPLVPEPLLADTLKAFRRWQLRSGLAVAHGEFAPDLAGGSAAALDAAGWGRRDLQTVVVDLSHGSPDDLFAGCSSMRRRSLRKAEKNGVTVRAARPGELGQVLPVALAEAYAASGSPNPYPGRTAGLVEDWARDREDVLVLVGHVGDELAGSVVCLAGHRTALFWVGASLRRFRDARINDRLYLGMLEWAIAQGAEQMDLCGSVHDGIRDYKLTFGGVERDYVVGESSLAPSALLSFARSARRRLSS
jgi:hypothetical protein